MFLITISYNFISFLNQIVYTQPMKLGHYTLYDISERIKQQKQHRFLDVIDMDVST